MWPITATRISAAKLPTIVNALGPNHLIFWKLHSSSDTRSTSEHHVADPRFGLDHGAGQF